MRDVWLACAAASALLLLCPISTRADGADAGAAKEAPASLRVAVAGSAPFVIDRGGEPVGLAIDVWRAVGASLAPRWTYARYDSVDDAIAALEADQADLVVGPVSITAKRARRVAFTQPFHQSTLSLLAPAAVSYWDRMRPFMSKTFLVGVSFLLVVLGAVGVLLWLCERKQNSAQFPADPARGIGNGIWLALVTMTTVGYGDRAPLSMAGRFVAGVWMVLAMITASSLTASIATALTLSQIETPSVTRVRDLADLRVAAPKGSPAATFVKEFGGRLVAVSSLADAVLALQQEKVSAVVWDRPVLAYYLNQHPEQEISLSDKEYDPLGYGFAMQKHASDDVARLNVALLELAERDGLDRIKARWLGSE